MENEIVGITFYAAKIPPEVGWRVQLSFRWMAISIEKITLRSFYAYRVEIIG